LSEANPAVVALVERELKRDPRLTSAELRAKAVDIDASVGELTGRQFHAKYALQVRRRLADPVTSRKSRHHLPEDPAVAVLMDGYEEKRVALEKAIHAAFERAIRDDSVAGVNRLFSALERHRKDFEGL